MARRGLLHTCAASMLAIAQTACTKARDCHGPIGSVTKRVATIAAPAIPFASSMQHQCLAVLSFTDDFILGVECLVETLFPPSTWLFNRIDEFVHFAEALPAKFDDVLNKFPTIVQQVPFLDWALVHAILWLNILISTLTDWGSNNTREKEIMVISCDSPNSSESEPEKSSSVSRIFLDDGTKTTCLTQCPPIHSQCENGVKCSYKEVLEKGAKDNIEIKEDQNCIVEEACDDHQGVVSSERDANKSSKEGIATQTPILELFETSWHMKGGKGR